MRQISNTFPNDYQIYGSVSQPESYYAIQDSVAERMEVIKKKYADINQPVPDSFTLKAYKFSIVRVEGDTPIYDIVDKNPIDRKINDLTERILVQLGTGF